MLREVGEGQPSGRDHLELAGPRIDMERGARLSGSRFAYLRGDLVLLELALVRYAMEKLDGEGFEPVIPPVLVREQALYGTGFLPDTEQQIYTLPDDDLYLVGTSEVALASLHRDEILAADELPLRYAGFSSCFRREAGAAGKDTRGIFRVHQFDKVEMFCFVEPDTALDEHERLLAIEESIMQDLGDPLPGGGDRRRRPRRLGGHQVRRRGLAARPGPLPRAHLVSNTTDYQARRLDIRYRPADGKPAHVATLNGTAVAVGRTIIALLENGQQDDGSVVLPAGAGARAGAPDAAARRARASPADAARTATVRLTSASKAPHRGAGTSARCW